MVTVSVIVMGSGNVVIFNVGKMVMTMIVVSVFMVTVVAGAGVIVQGVMVVNGEA
jgi:hypothetical protein